jgi:carotenoid 1,2-hydratase
VFSPYYYWRGRRDPDDHCAINVGLYGPGARRWTMTERGRAAVARDATTFQVGPSVLHFDGTRLTLDLNEISVPFLQRVRGRLTVHPTALNRREFALDAASRHRWMPLAPVARIEVELQDPALRWSGHAYVDTNAGKEPFGAAFSTWDWSRADVPGGCAALYDTVGVDGARRSIAARFGADGSAEDFEPPPRVKLPGTLWGIKRQTQSEGPARVTQTLEDTPFYARSVLSTRLLGHEAVAVHESLDVNRFDSRWVKVLLPFRMPRKAW